MEWLQYWGWIGRPFKDLTVRILNLLLSYGLTLLCHPPMRPVGVRCWADMSFSHKGEKSCFGPTKSASGGHNIKPNFESLGCSGIRKVYIFGKFLPFCDLDFSDVCILHLHDAILQV